MISQTNSNQSISPVARQKRFVPSSDYNPQRIIYSGTSHAMPFDFGIPPQVFTSRRSQQHY